MSKKPYIIQEDSPNLIIVPVSTDIGYVPVQKKTKLDEGLNQLPVQNCENSASVNNVGMKVKPGASCRNNSVLIDVRNLKKQPSSWAANFLQSIGESASTTSRSYTDLATKLSLTRTENTPPNATATSTQLESTPKPAVNKEPTQVKLNQSIQPILKEVNQPKLNKDETRPKQESLQLKCNKELVQLKVDKEILQKKVSKEAVLKQTNRETTHSKTNKEDSKPKLNNANQSRISKVNKEATQPKEKKEVLQTKPNKERSESKVYKEIMHKSNKEDTRDAQMTVLDLYHHYVNITKQKPNKTFETNAKKEVTRPKTNRHATQTNINRETAQQKVKKTIQPNLSTEKSKLKAQKATQLKAYKEALQLKANKKSSKQIGHKKASQDIIHKEISKRIISKETAEISYVKPSTASRQQKDEIRVGLKSYKVNDKNRTELSTNKIIKSKISKSLYREETKGISPIKSVVKKIIKTKNMQNQEKQFHTVSDHHLQNSEKLSCNKSDADLRTKLKRKLTRDDVNIKEENDIINIKKFRSNRKGFVPNENLIISFDAESDTEQVEENKPLVKTKLHQQSSKGKKSKNIKLTINLIVENGDTTEDEDDDDNIESCNENADLSFLDDFNIDEIVKSLNDCQSNKAETSMEIHLNNNTVINENDSMDSKYSDLPTNHSKEVMHTNDGKKAEQPEEKMLTEIDSSSACKEITPNQYSADTKYLEDKNIVLQLTNKENSPVHQNRAEESEASPLSEINVKDKLKNYKEDSSVEMSIKGSDGSQKYVENTTNISDYVDLSVEQKHTAVDPIQIDDNSVGLKPKINVCSNDDISTEISPKESESMKHPTQLNAENDEVINTAKCSRSSQDGENIQLTNNNHDKHVNHNIEEKLTTQLNDVKTNDASNDQVSTCNQSLEDKKILSNVEISQVEGEVIVIEDHDYKIVEVKGQQHLLQESIIDLTSGDNGTHVTTSNKQEKNIVETMEPTKIETDTEPILILETDYDVVTELKSSLDSTEVSNGSNVTLTNIVKTTEPTENIDKPSNDVKSNNNSQNETENSEDKSSTAGNQTQLAKEKKDNVNNSANPVDKKTVANKETASAKQNQEKTNTPESKDGKPKIEAVKPTNTNVKKQPTMPKQQSNGCQAQTVNNNDTKFSFANKSLAKDLLARNLQEKLQKYRDKCYSVTELIHKGKFSTVYCCRDGNGYTSAVKVLSEPNNVYGKTKEEMLLKVQKDVPRENFNIVRFFYGFSMTLPSDHLKHWCFVMEYYPYNLRDILSLNKKSFHIDAVQHLSRQLVAAVTILRNNNIIHSDIKPSHILLNEAQTRLKLCGFDEAFRFRNIQMLPNVGTPSYRAPELILGHYADYGIDVWATAAVMYEMATNQKLFPGQFNNDILFKQLCVLEDVPYDMLQQSIFKHKHYMGNTFGRILGSCGQRIPIYHFVRNNWIANSLQDNYDEEWAKHWPPMKRNEGREKIVMLSKLLKQMLVIHPRHRIPIEYVFANPFIF